MENNKEKIMLKIMHRLTEGFKDRLVLKGGMLMRLLNSNRATQDIDYVLLSTESKKILSTHMEAILSQLEEIETIKTILNSRGIFITLAIKGLTSPVLLEINVEKSLHLSPEPLSTLSLAQAHALSGRVISVMALPEAFSNKIAASLERHVTRDLYDLSLLEPLCEFDLKTLEDRLSKLSINRARPRSVSFKEAAHLLREKASPLTEAFLRESLYPLLPKTEQSGLAIVIKATLLRIAKGLELEK